jgi:hypothetical protein
VSQQLGAFTVLTRFVFCLLIVLLEGCGDMCALADKACANSSQCCSGICRIREDGTQTCGCLASGAPCGYTEQCCGWAQYYSTVVCHGTCQPK